jgi:hypothetical protein
MPLASFPEVVRKASNAELKYSTVSAWFMHLAFSAIASNGDRRQGNRKARA